MNRKSISDKTHFKKAILESSKLIEMGKDVDEIQQELKSEFQEHEIKSVVALIHKAKNLPDKKRLKQILKVSLWIALIFKVFVILGLMTSPQYSGFIKILVLILGPSLNTLCLYLVYKDKPGAYFTAALFGGFSLQGLSLDGLFDYPVFSIIWSLDLLLLINVLLLTTVGFILFFKLPLSALRVRSILEENQFSNN